MSRKNARDEIISVGQKFYPTLSYELYDKLNGQVAPVRFIIDDEGPAAGFFNNRTRELHLCLGPIADDYANAPDTPLYHDGAVDEPMLLSCMQYILGHEAGHALYTGGESYAWAVSKSADLITEWLYRDLVGKTRFFRNKNDYMIALRQIGDATGYCITRDQLEEITAFIANSLEDGRQERICSGASARFAKLRKVWRHADWCKQDDFSDAEKTASEKLRIVLNDTLLLATSGVHERGFTMRFAGKPLYAEMGEYIPFITEAYIAPTTRGLAEAQFKLVEKMYPTIKDALIEAGKSNAAAQALAQMLSDLVSSVLNSGADYGNDKHAHEDTDRSMNSAFGKSDLTIVLPDDVYDELVKHSSDGGGAGGGVRIIREHPLPDQDSADSKNGASGQGGDSANGSDSDGADGSSASTSGDGADTDSASGTGASASGSSANKDGANAAGASASGDSDSDSAQDGANANGAMAAGTNADDGASGSAGASGAGAEGTGAEGADAESANASGSASGAGTDGASAASGGAANASGVQDSGADDVSGARADSATSAGSSKGAIEPTRGKCVNPAPASRKNGGSAPEAFSDADAKALAEEAASAAAEVRADASNLISTVNSAMSDSKSTPTRHTAQRDVADTAPALTQSDVREIMKGAKFREVKHGKYARIIDLPAELKKRGETLAKVVDRYFKGQNQPHVRNMRSGLIDGRRLTRLARNDVRVFQKKGVDKPGDTAVYILIDDSGSMEGEKTEAAFCAAAVQEEGFKAHIPLKIVSFTTRIGIIHKVIKGWDEQHAWNCCYNFLRHHDGIQYGNDDNYDIRIATKELLQRPEKNRILIVLSDGTPSDVEDTKAAIDEARKRGVKVAGIYFEYGEIGMDADDFRHMYQRDYVCCTTDEIDKNLSKILKAFALH